MTTKRKDLWRQKQIRWKKRNPKFDEWEINSLIELLKKLLQGFICKILVLNISSTRPVLAVIKHILLGFLYSNFSSFTYSLPILFLHVRTKQDICVLPPILSHYSVTIFLLIFDTKNIGVSLGLGGNRWNTVSVRNGIDHRLNIN